MTMNNLPKSLKVKAVWISDVHLGNKDCKADYLLEFLDAIECETLYLVGDIIDLWSLKRNFYWPAKHNQVFRKILKMSRQTRVIYIPGNHDMTFRDYVGEKFGEVEIHRNFVHMTSDGRKLLMMHGDELDNVIRFGRITQYVGDYGYDLLLFLNRWSHFIRGRLGYPFWSLAGYIKTRVSKATSAIETFETAAIQWARKHEVDGIICGHIHHPNIRCDGDVVYCNDGDWIENCTSLVETLEGRLEIIHWSDRLSSEQKFELIEWRGRKPQAAA